MENENNIKVQVETFKGLLFCETIMYSGNYALLTTKEVKEDKLLTIQIPVELSQIIRIVFARPAEVRETPEILND